MIKKKTKKKKNIPQPFEILKKDSVFIKPLIKLNSEFKLVRTQNGMLGLLISDLYASYSLVDLNMPNGSYTETVPGLTHFGEHMVSGGSENFPDIYPTYNHILGDMNGLEDNAYTGGTFQVYFMKVHYDYLFEEAIYLLQ